MTVRSLRAPARRGSEAEPSRSQFDVTLVRQRITSVTPEEALDHALAQLLAADAEFWLARVRPARERSQDRPAADGGSLTNAGGADFRFEMAAVAERVSAVELPERLERTLRALRDIRRDIREHRGLIEDILDGSEREIRLGLSIIRAQTRGSAEATPGRPMP
jgi:predicted phage-related endonuclease